jgi:predicted adenylyl cyclase CyaB
VKILFLRGWHSGPGGVKPSYLIEHGHTAINPALDDEDFAGVVRTAQAEFNRHRPDVIVGSSGGGAVAVNLDSGSTPLVLLCPAWKRWGMAATGRRGTAGGTTMPSNIEIKARVTDLAQIRAGIEPLADGPAETLDQEDIFFAAPAGRLKLRILGRGQGELIHYHRSDIAGPKTSHSTIAPTTDPEALRAILSSALGVLGVVRKRRWLYMVGQTRVHLDRVEGLGEFVELEVVLRPDQAEKDGIIIAGDLMARLGIAGGQLVNVAYIDLIGGGP